MQKNNNMISITGILTSFIILHIANGQNCADISWYSKTSKVSSSQHRFTMITQGNYTIQALVTLSGGGKCDKVTRDGVVRALTIKYAIDKANNNTKFSKYARIGMQLDDVCRSLPVTMARGIEVVSLHRPNSVCRADFLKCDIQGGIKAADVKAATAVIGTGMSFTTIPLASLMSLFYIPQISYSASSRLLSKKELYKSFFRTIPSDTNQIKAMLDIFVKFKWNYIFAIGSDDDYGKLGVSELKTEATAKNVCISRDEYIPYQSSRTLSKIEEVVDKIAAEKQAEVVVLFCYVQGLGDAILKAAQRRGLKRIWVTSEAWSPGAQTLLSTSLKNQSEGILTVALKIYPMKYLIDYMHKEVITNFKCNNWLLNYLENTFNCVPETISSDYKTFYGAKNCTISVSKIMKELSFFPGKTDNLIDATTTLCHGIHQLVNRQCENTNGACNIPKIIPKNLTDEIFNISFKNEQGEEVSFNKLGDPKYAFYTIENLQWINGSYKYISVGNWSQKRIGHELQLTAEEIIWPDWVGKGKYPKSRCNDECKPGEFVAARTGCCWGCQACKGESISTKKMANECTKCGNDSHANNERTRCVITPVYWLEISNPAGMAIIVISAIGFVFMALACVILFKFRHIIVLEESAPHLITLSCVLLVFTFAYGPLHITKPYKYLCQGRNSFFFLLLMMYSAILLIKSKFMTKFLHKHAEKSFRGRLFTAQALFLLILILLELVSVIAWLYIDSSDVTQTQPGDKKEIWLQCQVDFTAARLVSTFIPCIVLIIATFCAFRERNMEHSFYEPKFLSFTCIALCIIIVAFLPTFKYVLGIYKSIVMAFTIDVFGYTYMACLILPKVYVVLVRHRHDDTEVSARPQHQPAEHEEVVRHHSIPTLEPTETSMIESSVVKDGRSLSDLSQPRVETIDGFVNITEGDGVHKNGYTNAIYEKAQETDMDEYGKISEVNGVSNAPKDNSL